METKYNVYIVEKKTGKAEALIGQNLNERLTERRVMTGLMRINGDYFVGDYEVGSAKDKEMAASLKNA